MVRDVGLVLVATALAGAPLAAGAVHRLSLLVLFTLALLGGALMLVRLRRAHAARIGVAALVPALFVVIPSLQSIPLPATTHAVLDRAGASLLADNPFVAGQAMPLSLDPPLTRAHVGKAAVALVAFLVAFHLASGRRWRHLFPRLIAASGVAAVLIGFGHRLFGVGKVYGLFATNERHLLMGPFINSNHTAAFLELAAFVCFACSQQRPSLLNRTGWLIGTVLCAVGVLGTLSRGGALGLAMGCVSFTVLWLLWRKRAAGGAGTAGPVLPMRTALLGGGFVVAVVVCAAAFVGAGELLDRFQRGPMSSDVRFHLWWDSLKVLAAHPLGIGRGAFDRVYPVYRTVRTQLPIRFSFVENEPLQLLLDCGWLMFLAIAAGMAYLAWTVFRSGRRDILEVALVSGLFAVLSHAFFDFALETPGVLIPFAAILGTVLGRSDSAERTLLAPRQRAAVLALALGGLIFGIGAVAHASYDDFDKRLRATHDVGERCALLERAQHAHPVDYYYVLTFAGLEPLRPRDGSNVSPRLHELNRALRLCAGCELVHATIARNLWQLGLRSQAVMEWRTTVRLQPSFFTPALGELFRSGARAAELAALAAADPRQMVEVASFLAGVRRFDAAFTVLDQADAIGAPRVESLLIRATLQLQTDVVDAATATLAQAHAAGVQDPRLVLLDAQLALRQKGAAGADAALAVLDVGAVRYPMDLPIQRMRTDVVLQYQKWRAADRAIEGLKLASYHASGTAREAHVVAARIQSQLGRWNSALGEYRIALADEPRDVALWMELGTVAERAGRYAAAREAFTEASHLSPSDPNIAGAVRRVDQRQSELRAPQREQP